MRYYLLLFTALILFSCKRNIDTSLETNVYLPIVHSTLSVNDLVNDSLLIEDTSGALKIKIEQEILDFSLEDLIQFPTKSIEKSFTVDSLNLSDNRIIYPLSLGEIARRTGGITGFVLLQAHGQEANIPAIEEITAGTVDVNANDFFKEAVLESGQMHVSINNELPVPMENVEYAFLNRSDQTIVASGTFDLIEPNTFKADSFDLAGKRIEGDLQVVLSNFSSPGTGDSVVLIDTNDAITFTIEVSDLEVESATAVFPTQNLVNDIRNIPLEGLGADLYEAKAASGDFIVDMYSTAQDTIYFDFIFPGMIRSTDGDTFARHITMDPATPDAPSKVQIVFDLKDYVFDLTGLENDTVNSIGSHVIAYIDSSGRVTTLSKADSFYVLYSFENIKADYVLGNINRDTLTIGPDSSIFDGFEGIQSGLLNFESSSTQLTISNGFGIDAKLSLDSIIGTNGTNEVLLSGAGIDSAIVIDAATYTNTVEPFKTTIELNNSNSNFNDLLNIQPNNFFFNGNIELNPNEDSTSTNHFAYLSEGVSITLDMEIPLKIKAENLLLVDTIEFNYASNENLQANGKMQIRYINTFPFNLDLELALLDSIHQPLDTLTLNSTLEFSQERKQTEILLSTSNYNNLSKTSHLILRAKLNSETNDFQSIQSDQFLDIQINIDGQINLTNE